MSNNTNSIISLNTRITTDETNITNLLTNTLNQSYLPSINTTLFNDNLLIVSSGSSFTFWLNGNTLNTVQSTFTIDSVTSCNNGSNPSVSITGSCSDYVVNFILEIGNTGQTGATGQKGDTGAKGNTGAKGETGPQGDSISANAAAAAAKAAAAVSATSSTAAAA